jgi:formate--tetrahydrofolate ligase
VSINHRAQDTDAEVRALMEGVASRNVKVILGKHFAEGGKGAVDVADEVVRLCEQPNHFKFVYEDNAPLWDKMKAEAQKIYHASDITADSKVKARIKELQDSGYGH